MILILDFDYTIFDTERFKDSLYHQNGIPVDLKNHELAQFIFRDVPSFLKEHDKERLFLMTFGDKVFQKAKVDSSDITRFFEQAVYTEGERKGEVIARMFPASFAEEPIIFVDDTAEELQSVHVACPHVLPVRMMRKENPYCREDGYECRHTAENMSELSDIIRSL